MRCYPLLKPLLFALPPETAHALVMAAAVWGARLPGIRAAQRALFAYDHPALHVRLWERELANPVGLAAGFDKDGVALAPLLGLGFGFVEVGTVTPRAQAGNPRPRLFRLPEEQALINRMGFNNEGAAALASRVEAAKARLPGCVVGVNVGKNRDTPMDRAQDDYLAAMRTVYEAADYLVLNVSSPNTPGLRDLQRRASLAAVAGALALERERLVKQGRARVPLLIKVAPDLDEHGLADVVEVALEAGYDGLIATNTTVARNGLRDSLREQAGGLSGRPLHARALATVAALYRLSEGRLPLVGVGGIASAAEAYAFIQAGASLVQLYSGLIFQGAGLVRAIKAGLVELLARDGHPSVAAAVGSANSIRTGMGNG